MPNRTRYRTRVKSYQRLTLEEPEGLRRSEIRRALDDLGSVVYVVPVHGTAKIGYTTNLRNRLSCYGLTLQDVMLIIPGGRVEEKALHERFASDLVRGREWFRQSGPILEFVNAERRRFNVPPTTWPREVADLALLSAICEAEADSAS